MRLRSTITIGLVLSAVLAVTPASAASRTVALGVSIYRGTDLSKLDDFRASIGGQRLATWTIWTGWDPNGSGAFPRDALIGARDRGVVPVIWWEPYWCCPSDPRWTRNRNITDGLYDAYIRDFARQAKQLGGRILIRFAHQANSDYLPWGWDFSATDDNTVETFIASWRHVVRIFREVGASNVKWVWSVATQTCAGDGTVVSVGVTNCMSRPLGYPGNKWVDYLAFTWENWGDAGTDSVVGSMPWVSMLDGFTPIVKRLSRVSSKPIIAVATASGPDGGDRAKWIRDGYRQVYKNLPRVAAIMWLHVDLSGSPTFHRDWSLRGPSLTAFAEIAAMREFQGRIR